MLLEVQNRKYIIMKEETKSVEFKHIDSDGTIDLGVDRLKAGMNTVAAV